MPIGFDCGASSLPTDQRTARAAARHSQLQTQIDEQPAGSAPGGCDQFLPALPGSDLRSCAGAVPKVGEPAFHHRLSENRMLVHVASFARTLVTRLLVTRILVKRVI
jgi:hypothetical protein